ncbi:MAG: hypothetical protein P4L84_15005 [Isosphaeraceae bacterium]|nr:hypothetical protein [Isosphaeraceae bacterium]
MALEASLEQGAFRVADALHRFAKTQGWNPESYRIFISVRPEWGTIHVAFLSDAFTGGEESDEYERYDNVMDFLEQDLGDDPSLYRSISMVLLPLDGYGFQAHGPLLSPGEVMIPDSLLNPGVEDFRGKYWPSKR